MVFYDLHTHTTLSDGKASVEYLIEHAAQNGYKTGISDHLFCEGIETQEDVIKYLDTVSGRGIPVGGETNIGEDLPLADDVLKRFNYLIASVHAVFPPDGAFRFGTYFAKRGGFRDDWEGYDTARAQEFLELSYRQIVDYFSRFRGEIMGHAQAMPFYDDLPNDSKEIIDWENAVIAVLKKYNVALEISGMWQVPYRRMLDAAKAAGLKFTFGSDCHTIEAVGKLDYPRKMFKELGLMEADMFIPGIF